MNDFVTASSTYCEVKCRFLFQLSKRFGAETVVTLSGVYKTPAIATCASRPALPAVNVTGKLGKTIQKETGERGWRNKDCVGTEVLRRSPGSSGARLR